MAFCSRCQRPLPPAVLSGNCPACLLEEAISDSIVSGDNWSEHDEPPARLGDYEILGEIGRGAMSVVYRARQEGVERFVALKALHGAALASRDAFERLKVEAQAVARLEHPNIVPLYEIGHDAGTHFITLRYFERGSLAQELSRRRYSPRESAELIIAAARAMHHAHQRGVLHRDLKPSNLLLDERGQPHIADFGLAKLADRETSLTLSSSVLGTPAYMAPEQAAGSAKAASVPADIYSLGVILFELLTGRPPFAGATTLEVLRQVADEEPPRPRNWNPAIDRDLEAICLCCLEKNPARRYATAAELADDLERWRDGEPISVRSATAIERSLKWVRRRPLVAALGCLVILALAVGLAGTTWQWNLARKAAAAARLESYLSDMDLVQRLYESQPQRAAEILRRHWPKNGEPDLRGWEWRHFWGLCQGDEPERAWRGEKTLFSIAISEDGKLLAAGELNGGAKIFEADTLELIFAGAEDVNTNTAPYMPSGNRMGAVVLSIPGTRLFTWSETRGESNCVVQFWDMDKRRIVRTFPQPYIVRNMAATAGGRLLLVSYQTPDGRTLMWDLASGKPITEIPKGLGYSNFSVASVLAVSPDGKWMTYDEFPDYVRVVETESGKDVWRFPLQDQYCLSCAFSPDGKALAVYGGFTKGTSPQIWDLETGKHRRGLETVAGYMSRIRFSRDGKALYASGSGPTVSIWDMETGKLKRQVRVLLPNVFDFALSPDEKTLFTVSGTQLARWDMRQAPARGARVTLPITQSWRFMPDGKGILGVMTNGTVVLFSGANWSEVREFAAGATNAVTLDLLPDDSGYVVGDETGAIAARRWSDHAIIKMVGQMNGPVSYLAVDPKTGSIVAGDSESYVVWDFAGGGVLARFPNRRSEGSADILPGKGRWTLLEYSGELTHVDLATGEISRQRLPYAEAEGFSYSPSGEFAVTLGARSPMRLYRADDWEFIREIGEARHGFFACFSPDGRRIATANSGAEAIRLWDVATGRRICSLPADIDLGQETRFSPDGNAIAQSGSVVRAVSVWWAPSWEEIARREAAEAARND